MRFCLGTVQFGMKYGIHGSGRLDRNAVNNILRRAIDCGIDTFDTAQTYGDAEDIIGDFIRQEKRTVRIISKIGCDLSAHPSAEALGISFCEYADRTAKKLGIDSIDGLLLHNADAVFLPEAVQALEKIKDSGFAQRIGVSIYTPEQASEALKYKCIDIIQIPYNVMDRRLEYSGFFKMVHDSGKQIYARSVLLQGLLTMTEKDLPDTMRFALPWLQQFWRICEQYGITPFEAAVKYVLSNKDIDYLVFGVDNMAQLNSYIRISSETNEQLILALRQAIVDVDERVVMPTLW